MKLALGSQAPGQRVPLGAKCRSIQEGRCGAEPPRPSGRSPQASAFLRGSLLGWQRLVLLGETVFPFLPVSGLKQQDIYSLTV